MTTKIILCGLSLFYGLSAVAHADFLADTKASLYLKNFYFNRDFAEDTPTLRNWSQAATLSVNSGYSESTVQFALAATARYAYRLNSAKNIVDNIMPYSMNKQEQAQDQLKIGVVAKFKYGKTELQLGELMPTLPVVHTDTVMQLPTTFLGGILESTAIQNSKISLGRLTKVSGRNSDEYVKFSLVSSINNAKSDALNFAGIDYDFKNAQVRYFIAGLEDIYLQHFLGYEYRYKINDVLNLKSNFYLFNTRDNGAALEGTIDSQAYATLQALSYADHRLSIGYKQIAGDTKFPLLANWVPQLYLANWSVGTYTQQDERSWQLRYDYNFKGLGLDGLNTTLRYFYGDHIYNAGNKRGKEKEFDFIINYDLKNGSFKGVGLGWLYADYKNSLAKDFVENRVFMSYSYHF